MLKNIKKYRSTVFIYSSIFHTVFSVSADPYHMDLLYLLYRVEGNRGSGVVRNG